jgi:hypothetical protein
MQSLFKEIISSIFENISLNTGNVWKDRWGSDLLLFLIYPYSLELGGGGTN